MFAKSKILFFLSIISISINLMASGLQLYWDGDSSLQIIFHSTIVIVFSSLLLRQGSRTKHAFLSVIVGCTLSALIHFAYLFVAAIEVKQIVGIAGYLGDIILIFTWLFLISHSYKDDSQAGG